MIRPVLTLLLAASFLPPALAAGAAPAPLIERVKFFGNATKAAAKLSPDGKWLTWLAPRDGVLNVWVAPASAPDQGRALTAEKVRPIRNAFWSPDSKTILFINDKGGDENFLLYGVNAASGQQASLTPFEKTRVKMIKISRSVKDRILVGVNNRDPRWHDVHSLDLATGKLTLVYQNDGFSDFLADDALRLRIGSKARKDGGVDYHRIADGKAEAVPMTSVGLDDVQTTVPLEFSSDGKTLYWTDARGRNTAALLAQDLASGQSTIVAQDARADIAAALYDLKTGRPLAYELEYLKPEYVALSPALKADLAFLKSKASGPLAVTSRTDADDKWTVTVDGVSTPSTTWLYDRKAKRLKKLFVNRPELEGAPLVPMHPHEIRSRDGMTLVSYLTMPKDAARPVPMVLLVHGGPWGRDSYGFRATHQWLANRGYAVLSVNFRGSTGFGKQFISAGDRQWGRKMHDDLIDAVDWAVKEGYTTRDKVAIMGGSYGGYAVLAGLAFTPTTFACGVDIVGPSNLDTLLRAIPPYWEGLKTQFYSRMGDPNTDEGRALLKERSPLYSAGQIVRPLLIGQGANDPRVNIKESDQIVDAMKARNIPVTYVVFPDEGHGFARPANNIAFNAITENFLAKCLGGRAEPMGGTLKASTAEIRHGAEYAPGLQEAAAPR